VAAVQLALAPGDVDGNLARAETQVRAAAKAGARLVVLPEFFNTGYLLSDDAYVLAEWRQGPSWRWVVQLARSLDIYLAGALLTRRDAEVYNTLLLAGPDGQTWHYEKQHPFAWERAFFRPGPGPVIAHTPLGRVGLLIGWDCAFPSLFSAYAGAVDLLIASTSAPRFHDTVLRHPDGHRDHLGDLNVVARRIRNGSDALFRQNVRAQAAALNVPLLQACPAPASRLRTTFPRGRASYLLLTLLNPTRWSRVVDADLARVDIGFFAETRVVTPEGADAVPSGEGDDFALRVLTLPETPPEPAGAPPPSGAPAVAYWLEQVLNRLMVPRYEAALGRQTLHTARFLLLLAGALSAGYWLRQWFRRTNHPDDE
jgi:predicted amidohydrolase